MITIARLNLWQVLAAIFIGAVIGLVVIFLTAPTPVIVPVQVITPVPTPPPVVITQPTVQPTPQPTAGTCSPDTGLTGTLLFLMILAVPIVAVMLFYSGGESSGLIGAIISFIVLAIMFMLFPVILNATMCAVPAIP